MLRFVLLLLSLLATPAFAADVPKWIMDAPASKVTFQPTWTGNAISGRFDKFTADIAFDPGNLAASRVRAEIDMTSMTTEYDERDEEIAGPLWFDIKKFPAAVFESKTFEKTPDGYIARGQLTLRGVTRDIDLPFTLDITADGKQAVMKGGLTLDRRHFGVGGGAWADSAEVAFEVPVSVEITARSSTP